MTVEKTPLDAEMMQRARELIYDKVAQLQGVSMVEIENLLNENKIVSERDPDMVHNIHGESENIIFWLSDNEYVTKAVTSLIDEKKIFPHITTFLVYIIDRKSLTLPMAKRNIQYKEPHWVPITLCTYPMPRKRNKK